MTNPKNAFRRSRLQNVLCSLFFVAAGIAVVGEIGSFRAIAQRAHGSTSPEDDSWGQTELPAAAIPAPPPCVVITALDEKFDAVTPPALPPFWTAINGIDPDGVFWQTSASGLPSPPADTAPNAAWVNDPAFISDKYLDSPGISATESEYVRLTFRHNYNLEASEQDSNVGFDGGVLELSIDGGNTFQDFTVWGGIFETGGYNRTIATNRGSPIAGRPAWSGNSGGFITTVVDLPSELLNAVLRWRMASDNTGSSEGWRVDTANVVWCHFSGTPTPPPTPTPQQITLSALGRKVGGINTVRLTWSGANSNNIDVYRNSAPPIARVPNTGTYTDSTGDTGQASYRYRVCEAGTSTCSNDATKKFPH